MQSLWAATPAERNELLGKLGAGGMATVCLAKDLEHDRKVALKLTKPELAAVPGAERIVQELTTTATLQYPHSRSRDLRRLLAGRRSRLCLDDAGARARRSSSGHRHFLRHSFRRMTDTRSEAVAVVRDAILKTAPAERMRRALELSEQVRSLSLAGLRLRHPNCSTLQLVELLSGETLIPVTPLRCDDDL